MSGWHGQGDLRAALADCGRLGASTGWAVAPRAFRLLKFDGTAINAVSATGSGETAVDLGDAYQVVLFDATGVFRWWWDQRARCGCWSWLDDEVAASQKWGRLNPEGTVERLVVGAVTDDSSVDGWALTWDGFSAEVWTPHAASKGDRLTLKLVEYVSEDEHGNVAVVAERPCGWGIEGAYA